MFHCPYCGTGVKENEQYCIKCGKQLPKDFMSRIYNKKNFNKLWYFPFVSAVIIASVAGVFHLFLKNESAEAKDLYSQGEQQLMDNHYESARDLFSQALDHHSNFTLAATSVEFVDLAISIEVSLNKARQLKEEQNFQEAASIINEASQALRNYDGTAVDQLISEMEELRSNIKVDELKYILEQEPAIEELKVMLWEAESINHEEAEEITENIRNQIIDFSFSKASEQLNQKQFNDAQLLVEDGLKYAPLSEKLESLQATIDKEKLSFETAQQQRIEQAINSAAEEQELNENDAVDLVSASLDKNDQGNIIVNGKVKSVATIPIDSVVVEYSILSANGTEILTNEVVIFPDMLYPEEIGKFEFTHYDLVREPKELTLEVNKITWYTAE
ncbi:zinc-ribbon domain-containing protein [Oceanobacillus saliphilus]|uniref:zinc-ribbon domain-containing protein n=1 Tax=Oceanobacillus saliphilus TaxID=2925834 RepID=UPI00201D47A2|nr:zinc ribbon domain-containing protein [Oceanobacillus saliphilus]